MQRAHVRLLGKLLGSADTWVTSLDGFETNRRSSEFTGGAVFSPLLYLAPKRKLSHPPRVKRGRPASVLMGRHPHWAGQTTITKRFEPAPESFAFGAHDGVTPMSALSHVDTAATASRRQRKHVSLPLDWNDPEAQDRLTDVDVLAAFIGIGVASVYRMMAEGVIERPIKIGRAARWRYSYVKSLANGLPIAPVKAKAA